MLHEIKMVFMFSMIQTLLYLQMNCLLRGSLNNLKSIIQSSAALMFHRWMGDIPFATSQEAAVLRVRQTKHCNLCKMRALRMQGKKTHHFIFVQHFTSG